MGSRPRSSSTLAAAVAIMALPSCGGVTTSARSPSLRVEISIDQRGMASQGDCFWLDTGVTNTGSTEEEIVVWTNYAWSWISDSADIVLDVGARQNVPSRVVLKPGQRHSAKLNVCRLTGSKKPTTLRLGFVPRAELPAAGQDNLARWGGVFWSNPLTLSD